MLSASCKCKFRNILYICRLIGNHSNLSSCISAGHYSHQYTGAGVVCRHLDISRDSYPGSRCSKVEGDEIVWIE